MRSRSLAILLLFAAVLFPACSRTGDLVLVSEDELPADVYGAVGPERTTQVDFFFVEGNRLARVSRTGRASSPPHEVAVIQLLQGPSREEIDGGLRTEIPNSSELLGLTIERGVAQVNLSDDFYRIIEVAGVEPGLETRPEQIQSYILRLAQVVWTLNEITGIDRVQFLRNGVEETILDQRRVATTAPVARGSYRAFEPKVSRPVNVAELPSI